MRILVADKLAASTDKQGAARIVLKGLPPVTAPSDLVAELTALLEDGDAEVRANAAQALGKLGPAAKGSYPALLHFEHNDPDAKVKQAAALAAVRVGAPGVGDVALLSQSLKDPRPSYRAAVAQTIQIAVVREIPGEPTTFEVASKSHPGSWQRVDVKAHNGCGECSCIRWETVCWPVIRDTKHLAPSRRCRHLRAARELYANRKIAEERAYE